MVLEAAGVAPPRLLSCRGEKHQQARVEERLAGAALARCGRWHTPTAAPASAPGCWKGQSVQSCDSASRGQQSILKENMRKSSVQYSGRSRSLSAGAAASGCWHAACAGQAERCRAVAGSVGKQAGLAGCGGVQGVGQGPLQAAARGGGASGKRAAGPPAPFKRPRQLAGPRGPVRPIRPHLASLLLQQIGGRLPRVVQARTAGTALHQQGNGARRAAAGGAAGAVQRRVAIGGAGGVHKRPGSQQGRGAAGCPRQCGELQQAALLPGVPVEAVDAEARAHGCGQRCNVVFGERGQRRC